MIKILFFASLRELFGKESIEMSINESKVKNVEQLLIFLTENREDPWLKLVEMRKNLRVAVNHEIVDWDSPVKHGDEVAFLPPITGG